MIRDAAMERAASALRVGDIVVVRCRCAGSLDAARDAARAASAQLTSVATFGPGRLARSATVGMGLVAAHLHCPLGVDVEALTGTALPFDRRNTLHPQEQQNFPLHASEDELGAIWVRKEAVLKAFGVGLAVMPSAILTGGRDQSWRVVSHAVLGAASLRSLDPVAGFEMALAVLKNTSTSIVFIDCDTP